MFWCVWLFSEARSVQLVRSHFVKVPPDFCFSKLALKLAHSNPHEIGTFQPTWNWHISTHIKFAHLKIEIEIGTFQRTKTYIYIYVLYLTITKEFGGKHETLCCVLHQKFNICVVSCCVLCCLARLLRREVAWLGWVYIMNLIICKLDGKIIIFVS